MREDAIAPLTRVLLEIGKPVRAANRAEHGTAGELRLFSLSRQKSTR